MKTSIRLLLTALAISGATWAAAGTLPAPNDTAGHASTSPSIASSVQGIRQ